MNTELTSGMKHPAQQGYMWNCYGFTPLHLWGCHLVGSVFAAAGSGLLIASVLLWGHLPDATFQRLALVSIACFCAATSVAAGSAFTLLYFRGIGAAPMDSKGLDSSAPAIPVPASSPNKEASASALL